LTVPQTTATLITASPLANTTATPVAAPLAIYKETKSKKHPDLEYYNRDCKTLRPWIATLRTKLTINAN